MAVTKRKLSYYDVKTLEELRNIPNSYFPAIQAGIDNYKVPANSFFTAFPTKNEVYNAFPTKTEMYNAINNIPIGNGIAWIYDNGHAYNDTINALNNKLLPVYVYETASGSSGSSGSNGSSAFRGSSGSSGSSGTSAVPTGLAYVKDINDNGVRFYSLLDTNAEFTEYFVKNDNSVESTECKNVDACIVIDYNDPLIYSKMQDAVSYEQAVICKSANNYLTLSKVDENKFGFRYDSKDEHGYWNISGNNYRTDWFYVEDPTDTINRTFDGTLDTQLGQYTFDFGNTLNFAFGTLTVKTTNTAHGNPYFEVLNDTTVVKTFEGNVEAGVSNNVIPVMGKVTGLRIRYGGYIADDSPAKVIAEGIGNGATIIDNQISFEDQPIEYDSQPVIFDT